MFGTTCHFLEAQGFVLQQMEDQNKIGEGGHRILTHLIS